MNAGAWIWALCVLQNRPGLLGIALLVYSLGLRHAVDADHIAAIDNVTRKLRQIGQRPVAVGLYFALGHSLVVIIAAGLVAVASSMLDHIQSLQTIGGVIGTAISAGFLFLIAAMNFVIFISLYRRYRTVRLGGALETDEIDEVLNSRGLLARLFAAAFKIVTRAWHMFFLGALFGLGFDTATEVAMFGVSAAQAAKGLSPGAIIVFPVLFAAGMSLVDTADGVVMLGAYEWAFVKPMRKLFYNMAITLVSVLVALIVGGIELLGLLSDEFALKGGVWSLIGGLNDNFATLGFIIIGLFVTAWVVSFVVFKTRRLETEATRTIA
jgi:high-affinity nickel-transport protein